MEITDEWRSPWHVAGDCYRGVICLGGASDMWRDNENASDNDDDSEHAGGDDGGAANFHKAVKTALSSQSGLQCREKNFDNGIFGSVNCFA
jgi:hypothetical protein